MKKYILFSGLLSLILAACGDKQDTNLQQKNADNGHPISELNIYNWSDYVDPATVKQFEEDNQVQIRYDYYDSNETLEAKVLTGQSGYDIVFPGSANVGKQIQAGAYLPIDKSKISNYNNLDEHLMQLLETVDPGNQYVIPYFLGINTVGINKNKVLEILGELPENEWDLVFNPQYTSKLKSCGISYLDSPSEVFPLVLSYLGKDPTSSNFDDLKAAADLMQKVRPDIKRFSSSGYINDLARNELCVVIGYGGDINIARNRAIEINSDFEIVALPASNGAAIWIDNIAIPKDAVHLDNVYKYIEHLLDPKVAAQNGDFVTYAPGSKPAKALMQAEYTENRAIFPTEEDIKNGYIIKTFDPKAIRLSVNLWQKLKAGK